MVHRVASGQVLGTIAARYGVSVEALCRANGIDAQKPIRPGQRLIVPTKARADEPKKKEPARASGRTAVERTPPGASWAPFVKRIGKRGHISITGHGRSWTGYVIGPKDEVLPLAKQRIAWVLASWRTGKQVSVDERLIRLLARVSDTFGGRSIRVVSGYRELSHARHSKHKSGHALDFSIPGIPNEALRDYLRTFSNVGVGYYPNSTHVHLDVREGSGYWIDYSRPGQHPAYRRRAEAASQAAPSAAERRKSEHASSPHPGGVEGSLAASSTR